MMSTKSRFYLSLIIALIISFTAYVKEPQAFQVFFWVGIIVGLGFFVVTSPEYIEREKQRRARQGELNRIREEERYREMGRQDAKEDQNYDYQPQFRTRSLHSVMFGNQRRR